MSRSTAARGRAVGEAIRRRLHRVASVWVDEYDTLTTWPRGRFHLLVRAVTITLVDSLALLLADWLLPSIAIHDFLSALTITVVAGLLAFLVRPAVFLVLPQSLTVTAAVTVLFMGLTLTLASWMIHGVERIDLLSAMVAALIIGAVNAVLVGVLGLDEDESFYRNTLRRLSREQGGIDERPGSGFVIIQADGVAEPVVKNAIRTGYMPFVASWLRSGSHRLGRWEALAPSMTSAAQAGILHGSSEGIPAFRWWERDRGRLMVSNRPSDAREIEQRVSGRADLLAEGGTSIANLLSGGATRSIATTSRLAGDGSSPGFDSFRLYLLNPYNVTRGIVTFLAAFVIELFDARRQRSRDIQPRVSRGMPFPFLRAATTTFLGDMIIDLVISEMARGVPILYADYLGYDEVAHYAGPERPEAMAQLDRVDRMVRSLARAAESAPRRYHFILLSDHGQSQGLPFAERYGMSLEELVLELMSGQPTSLDASHDLEGWGAVNAFFTEVARVQGRGGRLVRRALSGQEHEGAVSLHQRLAPPTAAEVVPGPTPPDVVVAASGNLANIYLTGFRARLGLEEIERLHPGLLRGLIRHPGIGFVLVRSERHGAVVLGSRGVHFLDEDRIEGQDPLLVFGPHAPDNLRRLDGFEHVGDILVNSMYDPSTEEIAPFEPHVGAHGGLGGPQTRAFILYPAFLDDGPEPVALVGAEAVHARLRHWFARAAALEAEHGADGSSGEGGVDRDGETVPSLLRSDGQTS